VSKYKINDNKVYEVVENKLFTTFKKCDVPVIKEVEPIWKGDPIPFQMWQDIIDWCVISYEKFKSETLVFLYYDLDTKGSAWSFWIPPQITNGMTVKSDPDSEFFAKERKNFPDTMFGTVHHHCSSSAFQSGTDHSDELDREGLHFTVGHCNKPEDLDLHLRLTIGDSHGDTNPDDVIQADPKLQSAYESLSSDYKPNQIKQALDVLHGSSIRSASNNYTKIKKFKKHFDKVSKPKYSTKSYSSTTSGKIGYSYTDQLSWDMDNSWYSSKKTKDPVDDEPATYDEIADDVLFNCLQEDEMDRIRMTYLRDFKQEIDPADMWQAEPTDIAKHAIDMLEDLSFLETRDGIVFKETIESYLSVRWSEYTFTLTELTRGLQEVIDDIIPL
jgi:hypothetical protein